METRTAPTLVGDRYRLEVLLGEGGMARVFAAFDERLERPVAVKILRTETQVITGMRQRFQQEALIAARLIHPHIVAVLDFGEQPPTSYLVMERLPGTTLRDEIVTRGPLPSARAALVMAETLSGLAAAHKYGVLHRDIKPSNILLQQDGHTKITDFGIAKSFDIGNDPDRMTDEMTVTGFVLGTPGYLAPERRSGCPATVQSDLYAVGAVMVEALTGQRLGPGPVPYEQLAPPLRDVARRAMAPDPRDRFTSAQEMLHALRAGTARAADPVRMPTLPSSAATAVVVPVGPVAGAGGTAALAAPPRPGPPRRRRGSRWRWTGVAAVTLIALAAVGIVLLAPSQAPTRTAAPPAQHSASHPRTQDLTRTTTPPDDAERSAIKTLATSLANGALPGDGALAAGLLAVAAQEPGSDRQNAAQQVLSLAQVLLDGGGISTGQYQDVANVLQATGATVTTTTTTAAPPALPGPSFLGHGHGHERGDSQGFNG